MSQPSATVVPAPVIYATVMSACAEHPELQDHLVADFAATMQSQFGIEITQPSSLVRTTAGFRLVLGQQTYDLGRPEDFNRSELSDSELELVSGGQDCNAGGASQAQNTVTAVLGAAFDIGISAIKFGLKM